MIDLTTKEGREKFRQRIGTSGWRDTAAADLRQTLAALDAKDAEIVALKAERDRMREALQASLNWLASYPGGCAEKAYERARAALSPTKQEPSTTERETEIRRARLGVDGNCGFALLGDDIQSGEAEFEEFEGDVRTTEGARNARIAINRARRRLKSRINEPISYFLDDSYPSRQED